MTTTQLTPAQQAVLAAERAARATEQAALAALTIEHDHLRLAYQNLQHELALSGSWEGEVWNRRKNGEIYPALLSIAVVKDEGGTVTN